MISFLYIAIFNLLAFFIINFLISKNNFLIDIKTSSDHKQLISIENVPVSGGIILFVNTLFLNFFDNLNLLFLLIIFLIGLFADLQKFNSPKKRLLIQSLTIFLFVIYNDLLIRSIRIPFIDNYLSINLISFIFTSFCFLILINGSNFIDGANLQCSGYFFSVITILIYLNFTIINVEYIGFILPLNIFLVCFIFFNFFNKSYLGDGGSYMLSFLLGYILIKFHLDTNVSPYFVVLMLWYPAFENLFSIIRRIFNKNLSPDNPDILHLHHLLFNFVNKKLNLNKNFKLSLGSIIINAFNLIIFYLGTHFLYSTLELLILLLVCVATYVFTYNFLIKNEKKL